jgi:hypothetical protein
MRSINKRTDGSSSKRKEGVVASAKRKNRKHEKGSNNKRENEKQNNSKHEKNRSNKCKKEKQQAQKGEITSAKKWVVENMTRRNSKHDKEKHQAQRWEHQQSVKKGVMRKGKTINTKRKNSKCKVGGATKKCTEKSSNKHEKKTTENVKKEQQLT